MSNPALPTDERDRLVKELMAARGKVSAMRRVGDEDGETAAHD